MIIHSGKKVELDEFMLIPLATIKELIKNIHSYIQYIVNCLHVINKYISTKLQITGAPTLSRTRVHSAIYFLLGEKKITLGFIYIKLKIYSLIFCPVIYLIHPLPSFSKC